MNVIPSAVNYIMPSSVSWGKSAVSNTSAHSGGGWSMNIETKSSESSKAVLFLGVRLNSLSTVEFVLRLDKLA